MNIEDTRLRERLQQDAQELYRREFNATDDDRLHAQIMRRINPEQGSVREPCQTPYHFTPKWMKFSGWLPATAMAATALAAWFLLFQPIPVIDQKTQPTPPNALVRISAQPAPFQTLSELIPAQNIARLARKNIESRSIAKLNHEELAIRTDLKKIAARFAWGTWEQNSG